MKKSSNKSKSIKPGGAKRARRTRVHSESLKRAPTRILGIPVRKIYKQAAVTYEHVYKLSHCLYLIPFSRDPETGNLVHGSWKRKVVYNLILIFRVLSVLYKFSITAALLNEGNIEFETFLGACCMLIELTACCLTYATTIKPASTIDVVNSWMCVSDILEEEVGVEMKNSPFQDLYTAAQIFCGAAVSSGVQVAVAIGFFMFPDLPTTTFFLVNSWGVFPKALAPTWVWMALFLPIEMIPYICATYSCCYNGLNFIISMAVCKIFAQGVRSMPIRNLNERKNVESLCVKFEVENKIFCNWLKDMHPPTLLALFFTVVITLYIALKHTYLPLYIYVIFPFTGIVVMGLIFVISFDQAGIIRTMDAVAESLLDSSAKYLEGLTREMRTKVMKRARALQPVSHPIGGFAKFSISLPFTIWEEVLNQLLFLLSF